ncbi:MAG: M23 family peptidase, partial [Ignavibacteriae bacterium]|nr:M23 family peptidase [Ignavibacteriota bacterium]
MKTKIILFILLLTFTFLKAQDVELKGDFKQGSLIFGFAEGIQKVLLDDEIIPHDESGNFVFGFDRDDSLEHLLIVKFESKTFLKKITPIKKEYDIQRINRMAQKYVEVPKEENERIAKEREIGKKAREKVGNVKDALFLSGFIKPIDGGRISSIFGSQRILNGVPKSFHNGTDIAVPRGTP